MNIQELTEKRDRFAAAAQSGEEIKITVKLESAGEDQEFALVINSSDGARDLASLIKHIESALKNGFITAFKAYES